MKFPVFDLHCDTASALLGEDFTARRSLLKNDLHIDLERAARLPGYAQCFACFTSTDESVLRGRKAEDLFEEQLAVILRELEANSGRIKQALCPADIEENRMNGIMSAVLTIEGPSGFGFDPAYLEKLHKMGFRISTLGWNESNPLTGSHVTGGGLTDLGKEYVKEAQRLGILVDVSHISDEGFWDIMKITQAPVVATHSDSRAVCGCSRNLTDDMFRAICETEGVAGLNLYASFIGEHANLDAVCDHVLHFLELDPDGRHIALGGDLDGCDALPDGFTGVDCYNSLAQRLLQRGVDEDTLYGIYWNNAMGVMESVVCNYKKPQ